MLGRADASDVDGLHFVDRGRRPAQTRQRDLLFDGTEAEDDAPLLLIEGVEACDEIRDHRQAGENRDQLRRGPASA